MKIVLLKDVPKIGRKYDVKDVNDGYAINFLFPKKLAEPATPKLLAQVEKMKNSIRVGKEIQEDLLKKNLSALKDVTITIKKKTNENGSLFSGIKKEEIIEELRKQHVDLSEESIQLEKPIKELGEFEIPVEIKGKKGKFKLLVVKSN